MKPGARVTVSVTLLALTMAVGGLNITRHRGGNGKVFNVFQVTKFPNDECTVSGTKVVSR